MVGGKAADSDISNQQLHKFKDRPLGDKYIYFFLH